MLILSRKRGEQITVDGPCTIKIGKVAKGRVKLVLDMEDHVQVTRDDAKRTRSHLERKRSGGVPVEMAVL